MRMEKRVVKRPEGCAAVFGGKRRGQEEVRGVRMLVKRRAGFQRKTKGGMWEGCQRTCLSSSSLASLTLVAR